jgi:hypothetical protein
MSTNPASLRRPFLTNDSIIILIKEETYMRRVKARLYLLLTSNLDQEATNVKHDSLLPHTKDNLVCITCNRQRTLLSNPFASMAQNLPYNSLKATQSLHLTQWS